MSVHYAWTTALILQICILVVTSTSTASWRPQRRETCELHPDVEARILKDVSYWDPSGGITEDVALSVCAVCGGEGAQAASGASSSSSGAMGVTTPGTKDCNKAQRVLIENGTVFLTNLIGKEYLGPFEHIGFLVELYEASQVFRLPDVEFTYWHGDNAPAHTTINPADNSSLWPHKPPGAGSRAMPAVLAWSKWNENAALVVPYSGAFRCPQDSWDSIEGQLETVAGLPWEERREVAFGRWNGFCTHYIPWMKTEDGKVMKCPRTYLNSISEAHPDLLDAYDLGAARPLPLVHQNRYKYIVSTDGWSISSKFDKYLLLGSAILKAASTRYGFYYDAIKPYEHYLPFMVKSSEDIVDVVKWAKAHDADSKRVAETARRFALRNLSRPARLCYYFRLMTELSRKMKYKVTCQNRRLCVPLVQEIQVFSQYERTNRSCRYHDVLLRYGDDDPLAVKANTEAAATVQGASSSSASPSSSSVSYSLQDIQRLHEEGIAWPRDDLLLQSRMGS
ncbi:hypothetical protein Agub_g3850 [Astrephomene gubernaculifera]|uniref:Glycosyl transferase CAP10 domain-containing protein n=1 Tax=Astrephomene gubernaculifera TaxID=47775 RepID=A0AAD3HIS1_9CHLO|nr:hypothetical protein Agub_g3850 [Astrephomene gubernaculifera]